ncbi:MAG: sigma-70 family RNA polymerase sigma factor [Bdellovibrio sp.]|nr:sigma-70 family RNA polymerase sigma factor [Bdellovibrio sp.]
METQVRKPWLGQNGLPLSDKELKLASRRWDLKTWEEYLSWFDIQLKETQISPTIYNKIADNLEESIFALCSSNENSHAIASFNKFLSVLTPKQKIVIEMIFWQNKSEREIAKHLGVSRPAIQNIKKRALAQIEQMIKNDDAGPCYSNNNQELNAI